MDYRIRDKAELDGCAAEILEWISPRDRVLRAHATVLGLSGELGSGKTAFVQAFAKVLGVEGRVTSPTFVIARFYDIPESKHFQRLIHMDAYRIEDEAELNPLGWDEMLADPHNLIVLEWPEQIGKRFPLYAGRLFFEVINETTRHIYDKKER